VTGNERCNCTGGELHCAEAVCPHVGQREQLLLSRRL
jgi:hypothetical protein